MLAYLDSSESSGYVSGELDSSANSIGDIEVHMTLEKYLVLLSFCGIISLLGCKTASEASEGKSISIPSDKELTLDSWTAACERDLNDPVNGSSNRKELIELAGSADCKETYPAIQKLVDQFSKPSDIRK